MRANPCTYAMLESTDGRTSTYLVLRATWYRARGRVLVRTEDAEVVERVSVKVGPSFSLSAYNAACAAMERAAATPGWPAFTGVLEALAGSGDTIH